MVWLDPLWLGHDKEDVPVLFLNWPGQLFGFDTMLKSPHVHTPRSSSRGAAHIFETMS